MAWKIIGILIIAAVLLISGAAVMFMDIGSETGENDEPTDPVPDMDGEAVLLMENPPAKQYKVFEERNITGDQDPSVGGFELSDDLLKVIVSHGGGCPEQPPNLQIYWDETFRESENEETFLVNLSFVHTDYDRCEAVIQSDYDVSLSPIISNIAEEQDINQEEIDLEVDMAFIHKRMWDNPYFGFRE